MTHSIFENTSNSLLPFAVAMYLLDFQLLRFLAKLCFHEGGFHRTLLDGKGYTTSRWIVRTGLHWHISFVKQRWKLLFTSRFSRLRARFHDVCLWSHFQGSGSEARALASRVFSEDDPSNFVMTSFTTKLHFPWPLFRISVLCSKVGSTYLSQPS